MGNYYLSVGGTGHKILESMIHLCAAGLGPDELYVAFFDLDTNNRIFQRTIELLKSYIENRERIVNGHPNQELDLFRTAINLPFDIADLSNPADYSLLKLDAIQNMEQLLALADSAGPAYADLLSFFYTDDELKEFLGQGFKGRPYLGSAYIQSLKSRYQLSNQNAQLINNPTWLSFITRIQGDHEFKLFVGGSLFGGTGASCFPGIKKLLNDIPAIRGLQNKRFGAFMSLPYFKFPDIKDEKGLHVEPSRIDYIAKETLTYYGKTGNDCFDDFYIAGEDNPRIDVSDDFENGGGKQYNRPHHIELIAALGAMNFFEDNSRPQANSRIFLIKGNRYINLTDLPYPLSPRYTGKENNLLNFSLLTGMMLGSSNTLAHYPWYQKVQNGYDKNYITRFTFPNSMLDYFKRYSTWFYDIHSCNPNQEYSHQLYLIPNIEKFISRNDHSDPQASFSFIDSPCGTYNYHYNIYYDNAHLTQLFRGKDLFDNIFVRKPNRIPPREIEGLTLLYPKNMEIVILNILNKSMKDEKISVQPSKLNLERIPFPYLPKINNTIPIDTIITNHSRWTSVGNGAISDIAGYLMHGLNLQNIQDMQNDRNTMPAIYPVMTARPLLFRDRVLGNNTIYLNQWKCLLGIIALSSYFDFGISVEQIDITQLPVVFKDIYQAYLQVNQNAHLYKYIEIVYRNNKPLAMSFPDCLLAMIDDPREVLKGLDWCWQGDNFSMQDPTQWIQNNLHGEDQVEALELLRRWLFKLNDSISSDRNNEWFSDVDKFSNSANKAILLGLFSSWMSSINNTGNLSTNPITKVNVHNFNGPAFDEKSLFRNLNASEIKSDNVTDALFTPIRKIPLIGDLFLESSLVNGQNLILVTDQWINNRIKIAGPIYTTRELYETVMANKKQGYQEGNLNYLFLEDCFSDKLGYGPAFDAKAICLKVSENISAMLPFKQTIFNYFTFEEITNMVKTTNSITTTTKFANDGFTPISITVTFIIKKNVTIQQGQTVDLSISKTYSAENLERLDFASNQVMIWPDFEHAYWSKYIMIHELEGSETFSITPFSTDQQQFDSLVRQNGNFAETMYYSTKPIRCLKIEGNGNPLGFLGFLYPKQNVIPNNSFFYSVDFGTSNTVVYHRVGNLSDSNQGSPHEFSYHSLHITLLTDAKNTMSIAIRRLAPYVMPADPGIIQFSTLLYDLATGTNSPFYDGNILINEKVITGNSDVLADKNIRDDIKWDTNPGLRDRYLKQLALILISDGLFNGASNLHFHFAYPQAFSKYMQTTYVNSLKQIFDSFCGDFIKTPDILKPLIVTNDKKADTLNQYLFHLEPAVTESQANINFLSQFPNTYANALNNVDGVVNIILDIGGGSTDIAIVYRQNEINLCKTSSLKYGGGDFALCIGKENNRSQKFISNLSDLIIRIDKIKADDKEKVDLMVKSLSESFVTKPKSTLNMIVKKYEPTINHVVHQEEIFFSLYLRTFFSGLIYYAGLLASSLQLDVDIDTVNIYLCGNGAKLLNLEGLDAEDSFKSYFTDSYSINNENHVHCTINTRMNNGVKNEVANGMICSQTFATNKIDSFSIIGEDVKKQDGKLWNCQIEDFEYKSEQFGSAIFDKYASKLQTDILDTYGYTNIGNTSIIQLIKANIEKVPRMRKFLHDEIDLGDRKVTRLREPIFISEIKSLLGMF